MINQWVKVGESASRLLNKKLRIKTVSAIGSVTRNPVRKILECKSDHLKHGNVATNANTACIWEISLISYKPWHRCPML